MSIYLDYNASAPVDSRVLDVMIDVYKNHYGNSDSRTHSYGDDTRSIVENARKQVASLLNVMPSEIFFTSGSTESNNIAIQGLEHYARESGKDHFVTTAIEHKAVLESVKAMEKKGFSADYIIPQKSGVIAVPDVLKKITPRTVLVSIMHVNNETGIIQPVKEIGDMLAKQNVFFHVDATQSCGKLVDEIRELHYDMLSFSAHKLQGPQGVGALILKKKRYKLPPIKPIMYGGQQEHGIRPGTIPVALVAGCGRACELAEQEYKKNEVINRSLKSELLNILTASGVDYKSNGNQNYCMPSTVNICFPGVMSEALMISSKQFCGISNGSACTSKSYEPSYVLTAMGIPIEDIESSVRISWGPDTNIDDFKVDFSSFLEIVKQIKG